MRARLFVLAASLAAVLAIVATAGASRHAAGVGRLAFALKDATGVSSIYSVRPDGSGLVRLTTGPSTDLCRTTPATGGRSRSAATARATSRSGR